MKYQEANLRRIRYHFVPVTESGCWLWLGGVDAKGYGVMSGNGKAHRVSYEAHKGPIPCGLSVCHRCDVPLCVNPAHLFLGTTADNMADKKRKNRCAAGAAHGLSRMTDAEVRSIRRLRSKGLTYRAIAERLGINRNAVGEVLRGVTWRHVDVA